MEEIAQVEHTTLPESRTGYGVIECTISRIDPLPELEGIGPFALRHELDHQGM